MQRTTGDSGVWSGAAHILLAWKWQHPGFVVVFGVFLWCFLVVSVVQSGGRVVVSEWTKCRASRV